MSGWALVSADRPWGLVLALLVVAVLATVVGLVALLRARRAR